MKKAKHIVQSPEWAEAKTKYGTETVEVGDLIFSKHKIPFTSLYYGYSPKVNPFVIDWENLRKAANQHNVIAINFDCPNIIKTDAEAEQAKEIFEQNAVKAQKQTFAKYNVLLDLRPSEEELLSQMHPKTRYNTRYAEKNGITVREADFEEFYKFSKVHQTTSERQKFYVHSERYYQIIWETLFNKGMAKILLAELNGEVLSAWMFFIYENVLYYPYGGWSGNYKELFPNNLLCWEAIKLGKGSGCHTFDMWGASENPLDTNDPWSGFTKFKLGFGGKHVEYMDSYDLVLNPAMYHTFNIANDIRWKLLRATK